MNIANYDRGRRARAGVRGGSEQRIGGVANDGRYPPPPRKIQLGNSFSGLINSQDDVTAKIYQNNQQQEDARRRRRQRLRV